ncbi:tRNA (cytidine(34)-2'-O)-methyltransferase [Parvibaculum sp.]|uniref:tRNA (cytidine(34)-2'-O)-methyltransferase n=1 Tax=Parvibaculum sp. TaxID=2024848 RepID=UPI000C93AACA|nr:tRNA (cytidine(34)-2'-O)-methyltransferase [Parvibaculum sp.]MAB13766.1 tRNA methyltransferase [Parvibaculum sp.]
MRLALFEPDIPQNTGTLIRTAACLGIGLDVIEPCGFVWSDKALKRSGLDYTALASVTRHADWAAFQAARPVESRLILLTTGADMPYTAFRFAAQDILLLGRESAGVPQGVHEAADARLLIPMAPGARSLNMALSGAMVLGEALRQTNGFPQADGPKEEPENG